MLATTRDEVAHVEQVVDAVTDAFLERLKKLWSARTLVSFALRVMKIGTLAMTRLGDLRFPLSVLESFCVSNFPS